MARPGPVQSRYPRSDNKHAHVTDNPTQGSTEPPPRALVFAPWADPAHATLTWAPTAPTRAWGGCRCSAPTPGAVGLARIRAGRRSRGHLDARSAGPGSRVGPGLRGTVPVPTRCFGLAAPTADDHWSLRTTCPRLSTAQLTGLPLGEAPAQPHVRTRPPPRVPSCSRRLRRSSTRSEQGDSNAVSAQRVENRTPGMRGWGRSPRRLRQGADQPSQRTGRPQPSADHRLLRRREIRPAAAYRPARKRAEIRTMPLWEGSIARPPGQQQRPWPGALTRAFVSYPPGTRTQNLRIKRPLRAVWRVSAGAVTCGFVRLFVRTGVWNPVEFAEFVSWISTRDGRTSASRYRYGVSVDDRCPPGVGGPGVGGQHDLSGDGHRRPLGNGDLLICVLVSAAAPFRAKRRPPARIEDTTQDD
jgi:hypothetical protein